MKIFLPFFIPRAVRHEGILQKIKTVSTIQTTSNNWLNEVSRIFGRDKTIIDIELPPIPKIKGEYWFLNYKVYLLKDICFFNITQKADYSHDKSTNPPLVFEKLLK